MSPPRVEEVRSKRNGQLPRIIAQSGGIGLVVGLVLFDLLAGIGAVVLSLLWSLSLRAGYPSAVPVVLTLQWIQVMAGVYYEGITGRILPGSHTFVHERMGYLGLLYLVVLFGGFSMCAGGLQGVCTFRLTRPPSAATLRRNLRAYLIWLAIGMFIGTAAWMVPGLTQQLLALGQLRFVFFVLLAGTLVAQNAWASLVLVLVAEVMIGLTGFFSGFRVPLTLVFILLLDRQREGHRYAGRAAAVLFCLLVSLSIVWTGIKGVVRADFNASESRAERLARVVDTTADWVDERNFMDAVDRLVSRAWQLSYPALVLEHVPRYVPHENGELLLGAIRHVLIPRLFDPNKPRLNDSELVRRYAGVHVAGAESNTSVGLSFVAESYVDFGVPGMFLPLFAFGSLIGALLSALSRRLDNPELRAAAITVLIAGSLSQFEVPWTKILGGSLTQIVVIGVALMITKRIRSGPHNRRSRQGPGALGIE